MPAFAREFQVSTLARELPAGQLDTFVQESQKMPARVWKEAFKGFLETPCFCAELNALTMPALIIWGDRDTYTLRAQQDTLPTADPRVAAGRLRGHRARGALGRAAALRRRTSCPSCTNGDES